MDRGCVVRCWLGLTPAVPSVSQAGLLQSCKDRHHGWTRQARIGRTSTMCGANWACQTESHLEGEERKLPDGEGHHKGMQGLGQHKGAHHSPKPAGHARPMSCHQVTQPGVWGLVSRIHWHSRYYRYQSRARVWKHMLTFQQLTAHSRVLQGCTITCCSLRAASQGAPVTHDDRARTAAHQGGPPDQAAHS